jgi:hypothetical protein
MGPFQLELSPKILPLAMDILLQDTIHFVNGQMACDIYIFLCVSVIMHEELVFKVYLLAAYYNFMYLLRILS